MKKYFSVDRVFFKQVFWLPIAMMCGVSFGFADNLYVTDNTSNKVLVIDIPSNTIITTITVGTAPAGVAVTPNGALTYVANQTTNDVSVINTTTNLVVATIPVGTAPLGVTVLPDGSRVYVTNNLGDSASVIDTSSQTVTTTIPLGNTSRPKGIAASPNGAFVYEVNNNAQTLGGIGASSNTVIRSLLIGLSPQEVAISPDNLFAYVTYGSSSLAVVDFAEPFVPVVAVVPVGSSPKGVVINPDAEFVYVVNSGSNSVSVVSTFSNSVVATIPVGSNPSYVALSPDGMFAYVTNSSDSTISVIDTTDNVVIATITTPGFSPYGIAAGPNPFPIQRFSGVQRKNDCGVEFERYNHLTWTVESDVGIAGYLLYRNGAYAATLNPEASSYNDHNIKKGETTFYTLIAFSKGGAQGPPISIQVP